MSPSLSVIVPAYRAASTISSCLGALESQLADDLEVLVVDSGDDGTGELAAERFPWVRVVQRDERAFAGHARNLGVERSRGDLLAFTDADCVPAPDWVESLRAAHEERDLPVIGGTVANGNPSSRVGWAYYLAEFHRWAPGAAAGFVDDVPGCCWSLRRWTYERYGPFLEDTYCSDTAFHWKMARDGHRPFLDPSIRVAHSNPVRLSRVLPHEVLHGRNFARVRTSESGWCRARAALHAVAAPLLPPLLLARITAGARRRALSRQLLRTLPLVAATVGAWSLGELQGYAAWALRPARAEAS